MAVREATAGRWWGEPRWLALWAATAGFLLDAMDVLLYVFAIQSIRAEFGLSNAEAGLVSGFTLVASAAGGILAGSLADRLGRRRTLIYTILLYSLASAGSATARSLTELLFWRTLVGLGLGGEWSAGSVLVAESWPAENRAKAIGVMQSGWALGYMLASAVSAIVLPRWGWRVLFLVGVLPALLTIGIRRRVVEPEVWLQRREHVAMTGIFRSPLAKKTWLATALATAVLFGYWGLFTWLPSFLAAPVSAGGAGLGVVSGSAWMIAVQCGAFAGYLCFGWLADRFGRRPAFLFYVLGAAILVPVYGNAPSWAAGSSGSVLLALGPLLGFFGSGYFSLFGAMLAELFPTALRGAGQGFCYNLGRAFGSIAPVAVGALADSRGLGAALALNSCFFLIAAGLIFALPETKRTRLEDPLAAPAR
jgi:MFS family permease